MDSDAFLLDEIQCLEERIVGWKQFELNAANLVRKSNPAEISDSLVLRALIQCGTTGILTTEKLYDSLNASSISVNIESAKFFQSIKTGDKIRLEVQSHKSLESQGVRQKGKVFLNNDVVAEASWVTNIPKLKKLKRFISRRRSKGKK
ncbi:MAG: hypothetical protein ACFFBD_25520 [Candidatus Hodarchaeota archaeon]